MARNLANWAQKHGITLTNVMTSIRADDTVNYRSGLVPLVTGGYGDVIHIAQTSAIFGSLRRMDRELRIMSV